MISAGRSSNGLENCSPSFATKCMGSALKFGHLAEKGPFLRPSKETGNSEVVSSLLFTGWSEWNRTTDPYRVKAAAGVPESYWGLGEEFHDP